MTDFWGNTAIDYGDFEELSLKYTDKLFVSVSKEPFGKDYVLFVGNPDEMDKAETFLSEFDTKMNIKGITAYGAGIHLGDKLLSQRYDSFQGGAFF
jgi:hypothetical protein